jgi:hypothetical protein
MAITVFSGASAMPPRWAMISGEPATAAPVPNVATIASEASKRNGNFFMAAGPLVIEFSAVNIRLRILEAGTHIEPKAATLEVISFKSGG